MPLGDFVPPGTIPKPLTIGRAGRLLFGVSALYYFAWLLTQREALILTTGIDVGLWVGVVFALYYLPDLLTVGFSRPWGRWPQAAALALAAGLLVADIAAYGAGWAPPLGWGVFIFTAFFYGIIGVAFLLASVLAVPG